MKPTPARELQVFLPAAAAGEAEKPRRSSWTTYFVDVSNNNGSVDYRTIARNAGRTGITCSALKATEGASFVDGLFHGGRDFAERMGIRTFAYHFARPDQHSSLSGAVAEANHFCDVVGEVRPGEWRPMLDLETAPFYGEWVKAWNERVRQRLGVAPVLYSYWAALVGMQLPEPLSAGLVLAYPNGLPQSAPCPRPWKRWTAHQYSWHGHVAGVSGGVDLNYTPSVWSLLAFPARGAALEPLYRRRRHAA